VAADSDGVVLEALFVLSPGAVSAEGGWWSGLRRHGLFLGGVSGHFDEG